MKTKRVLITGANSYIGTSFRAYLEGNGCNYAVDEIDLKNDDWEKSSFSGYDVIFHVAGIAHADVERVSKEVEQMYYSINCDLVQKCAIKAKCEGVKQFIFMSSMIVYSNSTKVGNSKIIRKDTIPCPDNFYGDSKLQAEYKLNDLRDESFKIVILRPPMIYGKNSKGNFKTLMHFAKTLLIFPQIENERSMLYIENLCEFVKKMIDNEENGLFFPQNIDYVNTSNMVKQIAIAKGRHVLLTHLFNPMLFLLSRMNNKYGKMVNKAFGSFVYDKELGLYSENYNVCSFEESIRRSI